uniref:GTP-binding protein n=1 Tax=Pseudomonas sp. TaxID=306 RepID=UPI002583D364
MSHQSDLISEDILAYLGQHERKEMLRFLTCGNVDDGKSTLIGRLLHDSKMIYEDHLEAITRDSKKVGTTGDDIDLLTQLLEDDYNLLVAKDGENGVATALEKKPDMILMDISLPVLDGYE